MQLIKNENYEICYRIVVFKFSKKINIEDLDKKLNNFISEGFVGNFDLSKDNKTWYVWIKKYKYSYFIDFLIKYDCVFVMLRPNCYQLKLVYKITKFDLKEKVNLLLSDIKFELQHYLDLYKSKDLCDCLKFFRVDDI